MFLKISEPSKRLSIYEMKLVLGREDTPNSITTKSDLGDKVWLDAILSRELDVCDRG